MNVLAFDTTRRVGSLALLLDDVVVETVGVEAPDGFGSVLFGEIDELLGRHGVALAGMDAFAAASGPGSFTGIRVGLSAAKALAEVHGKPVVAVSNLKAIAAAGEGDLRVPLLDARRGELFAGGFDAALNAVFPEIVCTCANLVERLTDERPSYIATDDGILESGGPAELLADCAVVDEAIAGSIAKVAAYEVVTGLGKATESIEANYIRRSDAEVNWRGP